MLDGVRLGQIGCGVAGDIAAALLARLGAEVTPILIDPCPLCGPDCDADEEWREQYRAGKLERRKVVQEVLEREVEGAAVDAVVVDGIDAAGLRRWTEFARARGIPSAVLETLGDGDGLTVECDGLCAEAASGVIGTMGDAAAPTPFGYLFGEVNLAIRGAGWLVERLLRSSSGLGEDAPCVEVLSAADACIDAMDNPWQEYSLPGPVHQAPNSLTNANYLRTGPQKVGLVPYGLFRARDAWVGFVGASTTDIMAERLGRPELLVDERFASVDGRVANRDFVVGLLQEWIGSYESGDELVDALGEKVVVAVARSLAEVYEVNAEILGFDNPTRPYQIRTSQPQQTGRT